MLSVQIPPQPLEETDSSSNSVVFITCTVILGHEADARLNSLFRIRKPLHATILSIAKGAV